MANICIIPARGGSKRIIRKNLRLFGGKPIMVHSITAAKASALFDTVAVSTDDQEIAAVAREAGAEVPFLRSAELGSDTALPIHALIETIERLAINGRQFQNMCLLYATAPFVRASDLQRGLEILEANPAAPNVLAVTDFGFPIFRALRVEAGGELAMFWPEHEVTRSNDLPTAYHDAGQFNWLRVAAVLKEKRQYFPGMLPLILPRYRVQDIDTEEDWKRAEKLFAAGLDDPD